MAEVNVLQMFVFLEALDRKPFPTLLRQLRTCLSIWMPTRPCNRRCLQGLLSSRLLGQPGITGQFNKRQFRSLRTNAWQLTIFCTVGLPGCRPCSSYRDVVHGALCLDLPRPPSQAPLSSVGFVQSSPASLQSKPSIS